MIGTPIDHTQSGAGEAVRELLLADSAVDPSRIFLIRGELVTVADGKLRKVLSLK